MNNAKFKLVFLIPHNCYGGVTRVFSELAKALVKRGHEVEVVVPFIPHWTYFQIALKNESKITSLYYLIKHIAKSLTRELFYKFKWLGDLRGSIKVRRYFTKPSLQNLGKSDWYFLNGWYQYYEIEAFKSIHKRLVQYIHHYDDYADDSLIREERRAYGNDILKITSCKNTSRKLISLGIQVKEIVFFGVNPQYFHQGSSGRRNRSILLYRGVEERKGFRVGLEAMDIIRSHHPDIEIRLVCLSNRYPPPKGYLCSSALTDEQLGDLLREHSIFIFPSLMEGFALPPLEAMACGCAVVTTKVGAVEEYAVHGKSAYLVEPGDSAAIVEAVEKLLKDDDLRSGLSREAASSAALYTWEDSARALENILYREGENGK